MTVCLQTPEDVIMAYGSKVTSALNIRMLHTVVQEPTFWITSYTSGAVPTIETYDARAWYKLSVPLVLVMTATS